MQHLVSCHYLTEAGPAAVTEFCEAWAHFCRWLLVSVSTDGGLLHATFVELLAPDESLPCCCDHAWKPLMLLTMCDELISPEG